MPELPRTLVLATACAGCLLWGCSQSEEISPPAAPEPQALDLSSSPAPNEPLAPIEIPIIEIETATGEAVEDQIAAAIGSEGRGYFRDDDGQVIPRSSLEMLQHAAEIYLELRATLDDDVPMWPPLTDLSLLVRYRILSALPAAPTGQKFVYDPQTYRVVLASQ